MRVITWNVEWATPRSERTTEILRRLEGHRPEVVCLTETDVGLLSHKGHFICSQADYGYTLRESRRKVALWSRRPWHEVDATGHGSMPPGRFVSGVTQTSIGEVLVVGVCIPWSGSRTEARREGNRKRRWEDHEEYLICLTQLLKRLSRERLIVMGDFNQAIGPAGRAPKRLRRLLQEALPPSIGIATSEVAHGGRRSIDHIALSEDLSVGSTWILSNVHDGRRLSDHFGVAAELSLL